MPVPCGRLEGKMPLWLEVTHRCPHQDGQQHDRAQRDVHSMKAGHHEECGAIDTCTHGQAEFRIRMPIFLDLQKQEKHSQSHRGSKTHDHGSFLAGLQGMMRPCERPAAGQQNGGIDGRQWPPAHGEKAAAFPMNTKLGRAIGWPDPLKARPQQGTRERLVTMTRKPCQGKKARINQGTKKTGEKTDFRKDEPAHAPAETAVNLLIVKSAQALMNDIAKPAKHHPQDQSQPQEQNP